MSARDCHRIAQATPRRSDSASLQIWKSMA
jgi:hypothetical protein